MGCSSSSPAGAKTTAGTAISTPSRQTSGKLSPPPPIASTPALAPAPVTTRARPTRLTKEEVDQRIVSSGAVLSRQLAGIDLKYAFVSQRGYYPNGIVFVKIKSFFCQY